VAETEFPPQLSLRVRRAPVFYIDQSEIILGEVGSGRDISRPTNRRSGRSADVGISLPEQRSFVESFMATPAMPASPTTSRRLFYRFGITVRLSIIRILLEATRVPQV